MADIYESQNQYEAAIELLRPLSETGFMKEDRILSNLKMGNIFLEMRQIEKSLSHYAKVIHETGYDSLKVEALYKSGAISFYRNVSQSRDFLNSMIPLDDHSVYKYSAYMLLGKIAEKEKQPQKAVSLYQKALEFCSVPSEFETARITLAKCFLLCGDRHEAGESFDQILGDKKSSASARKTALLYLANMKTPEKPPDPNFYWYNLYLKIEPADEMHPFILIRMADDYLNRGFLNQGWNILRQVWENYPNHETAPMAYYRYAHSLESESNHKEAAAIYHQIADRYSQSIFADSAVLALQKIRPGNIRMSQTDFLRFQMLFSKTLSNPDDFENLLQYSRFLADDLGFPHAAVPSFHQCLRLSPSPDRSAEVIFALGSVFYRMAVDEFFAVNRDSAMHYFKRLFVEFPGDSRTAEAALLYGNLAARSRINPVPLYKKIVTSNSSADGMSALYHKIMEHALKTDSLVQSVSYLNAWIDRERSGSVLPQYYFAHTQMKQSNWTAADSILRKIEHSAGPNLMPDILLARAHLAELSQNDSLAAGIYLKIIREYPFVSFSDSIRILTGEILLGRHMYDQAYRLYQSIILTDSIKMLAHETGLLAQKPALHPSSLKGFAQACEGLKQFAEARSVFIRYHELYAGENLNSLYLILARISEKEGNFNRAIGYLEQIPPSEKDAGLYAWLAGLYDKSGLHDTAYEKYQMALGLCRDSNQVPAIHQKLVLNLLRQDKIPEAESRITIFEKSFKKMEEFDLLMPEILYEKGKAHFRQKDFDLAQEQFEKLRDKYKKSESRINAELEQGRILVVTNKTEEALDHLIKMAARYPGDSIYYQIYLNLGDLYYRLQQYDNALNALNIARKGGPANQQSADRYLIRIYETMGLYEAALALTKQYIQSFPGADDILIRKVQIGSFFMRMKDFTRAIDQYEKILLESDNETEAEVQYWIGKCYAEMGSLDRAILEFLKVKYISKPTKLPWASTALYEAAQTYLRLGKPWEARVIFEKIVKTEGVTSDLGRVAKQKIDSIDQNHYTESKPQ
jgi:tetratricopeptide (TPR) repeat protein